MPQITILTLKQIEELMRKLVAQVAPGTKRIILNPPVNYKNQNGNVVTAKVIDLAWQGNKANATLR